MLKFQYVPHAFGIGTIIPIPKSKVGVNDKTEHYCRITISSVISKVFERCLLICMKKYCYSSERQFGFKAGVGCNNAIFAVRKVVDFLTSNNSTAIICSLDLEKAFDRLDHKMLYCELMERNVPIFYIRLLSNWYGKLYSSVVWAGVNSLIFSVCTGVQQGGILSPIIIFILRAVY